MATFTSLAEDLLARAKALDAHIASQGKSLDTVDHTFLVNLPSELQQARDELINGSAQLRRVAEGPESAMQTIALSWTDVLSLRGVYHYKIAQAVPLDGTATYAEIAAATGQPQQLVFRFIRHAMISAIFDEPEPGRVSHTPMSRLLVESPNFNDLMGWCIEELAPVSARYTDAIDKFGFSPEPIETAFNLTNDSNLPVHVMLGKTPDRARRFGGAMRSLATHDNLHVRHVLAGFDWAGYDKPGAVTVDVAGGMGHISHYLAKNTQHIKYIVQDLPHVIEQAKKVELPTELDGRIEYLAQDFFDAQTIPPADVIFLRGVLHNWSDKYAKKIISNLIPIVKKGTRVVIYETILEAEPVKDVTKRIGLDIDLMMAIGWNAMERSSADHQALFKAVDERFVWVADHRSTSKSISSVEMSFEPAE